MGRSHKEPFAAGLRLWHLDQDRLDRREEKDSLGHSGQRDGYNVVLGLGRSPATLRGSPHFQAAPTAVIDALLYVGCGAQAHEIRDDGRMDVVLPLVVALPQKGVADSKFEVLMRNPRGRSHQGIPRSSCRLALQLDQSTRDPRQPILGALGHQYPSSLRRLSRMMKKSDQNDQSCAQSSCGR